jgi:hypothetical protein
MPKHEGVESLAKQTADYLAEYIVDELGESPPQVEVDRLVGRRLADFNKKLHDELHTIIDFYYGFARRSVGQ